MLPKMCSQAARIDVIDAMEKGWKTTGSRDRLTLGGARAHKARREVGKIGMQDTHAEYRRQV